MRKRGKILRDTSAGPGLLTIDGQQYPFQLEGVWRSEIPPSAGMVVEAELDATGQISAIYGVSESQLAKEQTEIALAAAKEKGAALAAGMVARFGLHSLIAAGLLLIAWFYLAAVSIHTPLGSLDFSLWQVLGFLNAKNAMQALMMGGRGGSGPGLYGLLAIVAIAGPFVHHFWKDRRAVLAGLLPLLFMVAVAIAVRSAINDSFAAPEAEGFLRGFAERAREEAMKAISVGMGTYLGALVSLYFAGVSVKQFLVSSAVENPAPAPARFQKAS